MPVTSADLAKVSEFITAYKNRIQDQDQGDVGLSSDNNELLDVCQNQFPAMIVVGAQSSGKSSVLSRFVGADLLPSAAGRCTKNLTEITLIHDPKVENYDVEAYTTVDSDIKKFPNLDWMSCKKSRKI